MVRGLMFYRFLIYKHGGEYKSEWTFYSHLSSITKLRPTSHAIVFDTFTKLKFGMQLSSINNLHILEVCRLHFSMCFVYFLLPLVYKRFLSPECICRFTVATFILDFCQLHITGLLYKNYLFTSVLFGAM